MSAPFTPSPYQQAVFDWVTNGAGSAVVVAGPGSGKTKTVERCLPLIPERCSVQLFAFNTTIAKELQARIELLKKEFGRPFAGVRASTFHSIGYGALRKHLHGVNINVDAGKLRAICREWLGDVDRERYAEFICKLVSLAKGQGVGCLQPDVDAAWYELINHHDLFLESEEATEEQAVALARQLLRISNERAKVGQIDFDDQLYLVLLWKLRLWQNDWVFVDEAQDTNPVRRAIAKLALRPGGRLGAVGDPRQGIYGFTGASADAMELIKHEFSAKELPLTVCYRCAPAVVASVAEVYPGCIEAAPGATGGRVDRCVEVDDALALLGPGDAILCRNTAPIVGLAYEIIASGRGCRILGRDIAEGLLKLVDKMQARTLDALLEKLGKYEQREVAKHQAKGEEGKAEAVQDRVACIRTVAERMGENERTVRALKEKIGGMFADGGGNLLTLCTIHKAKGKEWPRVAIYRPDLMPSKWARQEYQLVQERNLDWVARSRAQEHLMFVPDPNRLGAPQRRGKGADKASKMHDTCSGPQSYTADTEMGRAALGGK